MIDIHLMQKWKCSISSCSGIGIPQFWVDSLLQQDDAVGVSQVDGVRVEGPRAVWMVAVGQGHRSRADQPGNTHIQLHTTSTTITTTTTNIHAHQLVATVRAEAQQRGRGIG